MKTTIEDVRYAAEVEGIAMQRFAALGARNIASMDTECRKKLDAEYREAEAEYMRARNVRRKAQERYANGF